MDANSEHAHALIERGPPSIRRTHVPRPGTCLAPSVSSATRTKLVAMSLAATAL